MARPQRGASYLPLETSADSDPRVLRLARILGVPVAHALGLAVRLWLSTARHAPDGETSWTPDEIGELAQGHGPLDPIKIHDALAEARFIRSADERGGIRVENVRDWLAPLLRDRERKRDPRTALPSEMAASPNPTNVRASFARNAAEIPIPSPETPGTSADNLGASSRGERREGVGGERKGVAAVLDAEVLGSKKLKYGTRDAPALTREAATALTFIQGSRWLSKCRDAAAVVATASKMLPGFDLASESRRAELWLSGRKKKAEAIRSMDRFLANWFRGTFDDQQKASEAKAKATDRGRTIEREPIPDPISPPSMMTLDEYYAWSREQTRDVNITWAWHEAAKAGNVANVSPD